MRRALLALALFVALALFASPRAAFAAGGAMPVHVLGIDSEDAEDQADALTGALRSRVRSAAGWTLQETQHSLGMLTAALRCPQKPDAACAARIGDQLHTDRFVWGVMSKAPGNQVSAEVHLWQRGKPDASTKETYSDNLKDGNDETLRKIASRIFDRLTGGASTGTVTIHAGEADGQVLVNGQRKGLLEHGAATMELAPGAYDVELRAPGFQPLVQHVTVTPGQETPLTVKLTPEPTSTPDTEGGGGGNGRKIAAWAAIGVGGVALAIGAVEGLHFLSARSDLDADRNKIDKSVTDVCAVQGDPNAADACSKLNDAKSARTTGVVAGAVGVVGVTAGVILLMTDHGGADASVTVGGTRVNVLPMVGTRETGVVGSFAF
jgi:hypothetical protein